MQGFFLCFFFFNFILKFILICFRGFLPPLPFFHLTLPRCSTVMLRFGWWLSWQWLLKNSVKLAETVPEPAAHYRVVAGYRSSSSWACNSVMIADVGPSSWLLSTPQCSSNPNIDYTCPQEEKCPLPCPCHLASCPQTQGEVPGFLGSLLFL